VTWGAFQAYGDPAWQAEAGGSERGNAPSKETPPASIEELLDELSRHSAQASRRISLLNPGVLAAQREQLATYIAQRDGPRNGRTIQ